MAALRGVPGLGKGKLALSDGGDEVLLLDPAGKLADAVAYGNAAYAALKLAGVFDPPASLSLQRVPGVDLATTWDVRHRFLAAPPEPFVRRGLPLASTREPVWLDRGYQAVWGSLGGASNFSEGYTAPPHYVLAEAAAQELDFMAVADPVFVQPATSGGARQIAARRSSDGEGEAGIYAGSPPAERPRVSAAELELIRSDPAEPATKIPWLQLFGYRETWAFAIGKFLTDPIWWLYLYWIPDFLKRNHGIDLTTIGPPVVVIYLLADVGSIGGGWLSSHWIKKGWTTNKARKVAMLSAVAGLLVAVAGFIEFKAGEILTVAKLPWVPSLGIEYHLAADGVPLQGASCWRPSCVFSSRRALPRMPPRACVRPALRRPWPAR